MANQSQPRPWFRLGSLARPIQLPGPPLAPTPVPRSQMQPPAGLLPRPTMIRPTFRPPVAPQPQASQDAPPPLQAPRPPVPPPQFPPVTTTAPPLPPPPAVVSPVSPPKPPSRITTSPIPQKSPFASPVTQKSPPASPVTQKSSPASPVTRKSPLNASPVTQKSPVTQNTSASPITQKSPSSSPVPQKSPFSPRASPESSTIPSPYPLPSPSKPKTQSLPPSILSSTAIKQDVARSMLASPPIPAFRSAEAAASPTVPTPLKPSNGVLSAASNPPVVARMPTPVPSPRAAKPLPETPPESPKIKSALHSPPLFSLPPSQLKSDGEYERKIPAVAERKTVSHVQDPIGKQRSVLESRCDNPEKPPVGMNVKAKEGEIKRGSNSEDIGLRVITISGENRGAVMELGHPPGTHGSHQKLSSEGKSKMQGSNSTSKVKPSTPMHAFMNSNVQGVNSSIVFNSTLSHHDPGVHLSLSRKPGKGGHHKGHENELKIFQKERGDGV